jgi:hypothetical protein
MRRACRSRRRPGRSDTATSLSVPAPARTRIQGALRRGAVALRGSPDEGSGERLSAQGDVAHVGPVHAARVRSINKPQRHPESEAAARPRAALEGWPLAPLCPAAGRRCPSRLVRRRGRRAKRLHAGYPKTAPPPGGACPPADHENDQNSDRAERIRKPNKAGCGISLPASDILSSQSVLLDHHVGEVPHRRRALSGLQGPPPRTPESGGGQPCCAFG